MAYFLFFHARTQLTLLTHVLHAKIYDAADKGCTTATDTANEELRVANISVAQRQVATELKTLARAGLVVVDGDGIRCGAEREERTAATDDTAAAETVASAEGAGGARRVVKRGREGAEGHDTSEMSDEIEETHDGSTSGGRESRGRRRRRTIESYVESDQESESSGADDWT